VAGRSRKLSGVCAALVRNKAPITYQPITVDEYRQELEQLSVSPFRVQHLCAVALDCQDGIFAGTDAIIEGVTGKPPMTVQAFVASHKEAFSTMSRSKE
jgi:NAD(P)H dehydrogenase (quinone)